MELSQHIEIPISRDIVWQKLNDPDTLKACLPGCETFTSAGDNAFAMTIQAKVGPVKARFNGDVALSEINAPESYTLSGGGKGGVAGFAKGSAHVRLEAMGEHTRMSYSVHANVGGKLAQLGARLVNGAARKMAGEFFTNFVRVICDDPDLEVTLETVEGEAI